MELDGYNKEQRDAILDFDHNLMILACAGSGKTRTITGKIAYAIDKGIAEPHSICAVTFTNKAANEMRERISALVGDKGNGKVTVRTFHSLGVMLLRLFPSEAGVSDDFAIADEHDAARLVMEACGLESIKEAGKLASCILSAKEHGLGPYSKESGRFFKSIRSDDSWRDDFIAYENAKERAGALDFPDLISRTVDMLSRDGRARKYCHERWKMVVVDEYQDSNMMQSRLLQLFAAKDSQVIVVGDDDQSIYAFRGALVQNILEFPDQFPRVRKISLERNYRSTVEILSCASALIKQNCNRYDKDIASATAKTGVMPYYIESESGYAEAEFIADRIREKRDYGNTAVLYRKHRCAMQLKRILIERKIPYTVAGGVGILSSRIVKTAIALMKITVNRRDSPSLRRVVEESRIGLGKESLRKIIEIRDKTGVDLIVAMRQLAGSGVKKAQLAMLADAIETLEEKLWNRELATRRSQPACPENDPLGIFKLYEDHGDAGVRDSEGTLTRGEWLRDAMERLHIVGSEANTEEDEGDGAGVDDKLGVFAAMLDDAESFFDWDLIGGGEGTPSERDVIRCFICRAELGDDYSEEGLEAVTLSTMHASKGLEYDTVFCIGLEDDTIPGKDIDGLGEDWLSEERRIFYVAMTRAKNMLYLCHRKADGGGGLFGRPDYQMRSRFLDEIPSTMYKRFLPEERQARKPPLPHAKATGRKAEVGERVTHREKGQGTIVAIEQRGERRILVVEMDSGTTMRLLDASSNPNIELGPRTPREAS